MNSSRRRGRAVAVGVLVLGTALAASSPAAAGPSPAAKSASLVIQHQFRGCHTWSLNGGPSLASQKVRLARGGSLTLTNNDLMAQELVKKSGPAVKLRLLAPRRKSQVMDGEGMGKAGPYTLVHMGARLHATLPKAGTYRFTVMDRGDYVEVKTSGDYYELALTVVVR